MIINYFIKILSFLLFFGIHGSSGNVNKEEYYGNLVFYGRGQGKLANYWNDVEEIKHSTNVKIFFPGSNETFEYTNINEISLKNLPLAILLPGRKKETFSEIEFFIPSNNNTSNISLSKYHKIKSEMKVIPLPVTELISEQYTCKSIGLPCSDLENYNFEKNSSEWLAKVDLRIYIKSENFHGKNNNNEKQSYYQIENFNSPTQTWSECTGDIISSNFNDSTSTTLYNSFVIRNYGTMPIYLLLSNTIFLRKEPTYIVRQGIIQPPFYTNWNGTKVEKGSRNETLSSNFNNTMNNNNFITIYSKKEFFSYIKKGISAPPEALSLRIRLKKQSNFYLKINNKKSFDLNKLFFNPRNCKLPLEEDVELLMDTRSLSFINSKNTINNDVNSYWFIGIANGNFAYLKNPFNLKNQNGKGKEEILLLYDFIIHHTFPNSTSSYSKVKLNEYGIDCDISLQNHENWENSKMIKQWPDDIALKTFYLSKYKYNIKNPYSKYKDGYHLIKDTNKFIKCNHGNCEIIHGYGYFIDASSEKTNQLIYCNNGDCEITTKDHGIFINSRDNSAIRCIDSLCSTILLSNSCLFNKFDIIQDLSNNIKICDGIKELTFNKNNEKYYYPKQNINASFTFPIIEQGNDIILLVIDEYSITQYYDYTEKICINGDYERDYECNVSGTSIYSCSDNHSSCKVDYAPKCNPKDKNPTKNCHGYYLADFDNKTKKGTLYNCTYNNDSDKVICKNEQVTRVPIGYFMVTDEYVKKTIPFIKCDGYYCKGMGSEDINIICNSLGDLISAKSNEIYICINDNTMVSFSSEKVYIIIPNIKDNIFGNTIYKNYSIFEISQYSMLLLTDPRQLYIYSTEVQKSLISLTFDQNHRVVIEKLNITDILPFKSKGENYGTMIEDLTNNFSEDELEETFLLHCIYGECFNVSGYLKYNIPGNKTKIAECNEFCSLYQGSKECNEKNSGMTFYDSNTQKFMICIRYENDQLTNNYASKEIVSGSRLSYYLNFSGKENIFYNLYISNKDGSIISKNNKDGYIIYNVDNDGKNKLLTCNNYNCYKKNISGYLMDIINLDEDNNMVYCEDECQIVPKYNGYYLNSNFDYGVFKCESFQCKFIEEEDIDEKCYTNYYEIILDEDNFQYCHNLTLIDFFDEELYFPLMMNIKSSSFPSSIVSGSDVIIVKKEKYSVHHYINKEKDICINNSNHTLDGTCNNNISEKYYCPNYNESCSSQFSNIYITNLNNFNDNGYTITSGIKSYTLFKFKCINIFICTQYDE
ncbi:hypothetical protein BCR36DRAFT_416175 [Piromyces finnis]|uniref:Uncharacterized protein n=1 Tax=Piromyces finnis TaxID=1754191 RepID=A0A1Y1UW60_9FUNG|nr:hypothetical protein BCR36DRAFT_416175 [Piromyces finnis]|eukprot:ORX42276.1 hypothetical protein BCR36DRAFT_416175 [Piromyces finnis]